MPFTVSQLDSLLSPYLAVGSRSIGTTTRAMLNAVLPRIYAKGNYNCLVTEWEDTPGSGYVDASSGYVFLPPDYKAILTVSLGEVPMVINNIGYQTRRPGVGKLDRPVGGVYGLIDRGLFPVKSEMPTAGADEFIFTCESATLASGDVATVVYRDTNEGYTSVALPLHVITVAASGGTAISVAADGGTDAATGEALTTLTVTSTTGLVSGLALTLSQLTGTDATYIGTFRINAVVNATTLKIVKSFVALTGTLAAVTQAKLMPVSTIDSVVSITFTGLPGRVQVKDADGIVYADLIPGSAVSAYRRYDVPQVPADAVADDEEWRLRAVVKRNFIPLTADSDIVYVDSIPALTEAFLATVARDNSQLDRYHAHWNSCFSILADELYDERGGITEFPTVEQWGSGVPALDNRF